MEEMGRMCTELYLWLLLVFFMCMSEDKVIAGQEVLVVERPEVGMEEEVEEVIQIVISLKRKKEQVEAERRISVWKEEDGAEPLLYVPGLWLRREEVEDLVIGVEAQVEY